MDREFIPDSVPQDYGYPLNKAEADSIVSLSQHPGWATFLKCLSFEAEQFRRAALQVGYGPYAIEKFRFNQALSQNIERIPLAVLESANAILDAGNTLDSIYDKLLLDPE